MLRFSLMIGRLAIERAHETILERSRIVVILEGVQLLSFLFIGALLPAAAVLQAPVHACTALLARGLLAILVQRSSSARAQHLVQ